MSKCNYVGKRVVVSGCFSGMGEATARQLLELGAEVHGIDYKDTALALTSFSKVDLRDPQAIDAAAEQLGRKCGKIDALFNCAGLPQTFPPVEVVKVNYLGARRLTERLLPYMGRGAAIVCISSTAGIGWSERLPVLFELLGIDDFSAAVAWCEGHPDEVREGYSFSKEAIILWTMSFGAVLIKQGIRMNCTLPGPTQTPMMKEFEAATPSAIIEAAAQPINRRSSAEEQANVLVFLNSDAASYINGIAMPVDGGFCGAVMTGQIDMKAVLAAATA
ncbi:MAG: coniferyl-alcohol dehydrogenase [Sinobacteraceae bacterium]|nr:coniferyl-alcohol dehydrogenase [Nevskiaceae bacterium]